MTTEAGDTTTGEAVAAHGGGASVRIPRTLTVRELADLLNDTPVQIIKVLMTNGVMADVSKIIDFDTAAVVAVEMGFDPQEGGEVVPERAAQVADIFAEDPDDAAAQAGRPPVIAVLGHVDHGKTSLLDAIRKTKVAEGEAGGITQRVGAYQAEANDRALTFIDTPGHEAFTQMRARGAEATDIAVLVVAANDGVMPQTREAIDHIRAADVPLIVALNKMDLDNINPDRVKAALAEAGVNIEEYGGDVPLVPTSAETGDGIDALIDTILLVSELQDLKANPDREAAGVVIEAELDRRQGPRTTLLVQRGTLKQGDALLVGHTWGRIKAIFDFTGERVKEAGPSIPVVVLGVQEVAEAGDRFLAVKNEKAAKKTYETAKRQREAAEAQLQHAASLDSLFGEISRGDVSELNLVLKTDVVGSVAALRDSLEKLSNPEVRVKVIHAAAGAITESDVNLALVSAGIIIAFSTSIEPGARKLADGEGVEIREYDIIYNVIDEVEAAISGLLAPVDIEVIDAKAKVLQVFPIRRIGNIAGSRSLEGVVRQEATARVSRNGETVAEGPISSLRRFQEDVQEVQAGQEFGVAVRGFEDFEEGDELEFFHVETQSRISSRGEIQPAETRG